jgi:endonuclease V-like protein UPF0215 family
MLGVDDGVFVPHSKGTAPVIGVVYRGGYWFDGLMHTEVEVDGFDATWKIGDMICRSPHFKQLRIIVLNGVTFAGFNVVNIKKLYRNTQLPVIAVVQKKPNFKDIHKALQNLSNSDMRWKAILDAGQEYAMTTRRGRGRIYFHLAGMFEEDAEKIIQQTSTRSNVPEALRVAHLVASGIST